MSRPQKPKVNSASQKEIDAAQENFDKFQEQIDNVSNDLSERPKSHETEPQAKLTADDWKKSEDIYLKPTRTQYPGPVPKTGVMTDKFNEKFREQYEFDKQFVRFIAENAEIIGESIVIWTRPYPGMPAEQWTVPVNKPVWGPRYLAEQIKRKFYRRLKMEERSSPENQIGSDGVASFYGKVVVESTIQRLDARSAPKQQVSMNRKVSNF